MALTKEQLEFVKEVEAFKREANEAIKEARELNLKLARQVKAFNKVEKKIRDMAKEHGIS